MTDYFLGVQKSLQMVAAAVKLKVTTNLNNILKSRDITLLTKVHVVKGMVFPVVIHVWM